MAVRRPTVAGQFYPESGSGCRREIEQCLSGVGLPTREKGAAAIAEPGARAIGGVVPHAGWVCSGAVAAEVIRHLAADSTVETFVVFGAVHRVVGSAASVAAAGAWSTPLGEIPIDGPLAQAVVKASPLLVESTAAHSSEHSIEVQVPFIRHLAPQAKLLPITVPPTAASHEVGRVVAEQARALGRRAVFLGSTDLTHYGPRYWFTPQGAGPESLRWAKEVNDRRIIDLILAMQADKVVPEAMEHHNACGSGAVAAVIAAAQATGATRARLLRHVTSYEVLRARLGEMDDAVGYAGVIFDAPGQAS